MHSRAHARAAGDAIVWTLLPTLLSSAFDPAGWGTMTSIPSVTREKHIYLLLRNQLLIVELNSIAPTYSTLWLTHTVVKTKALIGSAWV